MLQTISLRITQILPACAPSAHSYPLRDERGCELIGVERISELSTEGLPVQR